MTNPWLSIVLALAVPSICLFGGGALIEALSHRSRAEELRKDLPKGDREPLFRRWRGYDREAVHRNWAPLHRGEPAREPARTAARVAERTFYELDLVYPFVYGGGLAAGLLLCWATLGRPFDPLWLLAPVVLALLADWTENTATLRLLADYDADLGGASLAAATVRLASWATQAKLALLVASLTFWVVLLGWAIACTVRRG